MMKRIFVGVIIAFTFFACNNEVDLNGEWRDVPVVYGLLDAKQDTQFIRINRAFLSDENVFITAQKMDSIIYPVNILNVTVEEYNNNILTRTIVFDTITANPKNPGIFAQEPNRVYFSTETLNDQREYVLRITNNETGREITARTPMISGLLFQTPPNQVSLIPTPIEFYNLGGTGYTIRWRSARNGKIYQPEIVFNYEETINGVTTPKVMRWTFGNQFSSTTNPGETMDLRIDPDAFYKAVQNQIPVNPDAVRKIGLLEVVIYVGSEELYNYIILNQPSASIIQDRPLYSNIVDGIGVFASRTSFSRPNLTLGPFSRDSLIDGRFTKDLGFVQ